MEQSVQKLKPIVDKLGFLKYATEQDYKKRHRLVKFAFLDWNTPEEQYYMRLFIHTPQGKKWIAENQSYIKGGFLKI